MGPSQAPPSRAHPPTPRASGALPGAGAGQGGF